MGNVALGINSERNWWRKQRQLINILPPDEPIPEQCSLPGGQTTLKTTLESKPAPEGTVNYSVFYERT